MSMQKRCILPHPCNGPLYKDWTETDFFLKMLEEFDEVGKAYAKLRAAEREGLPKEEGTKVEAHGLRQSSQRPQRPWSAI